MEPANRRPAPGAGSCLCPRTQLSLANKLLLAAGKPDHSGEGQGTRLYWQGPSPRLSQMAAQPTAMNSDPSEPSVSMETTNRRMYSDMFGPLSGMTYGTTTNAQVANACLPAGELSNKTPIFISHVSDTCSFLASLRASCPGGLMAQIKDEKLMVVPSTAGGFRTAASALRYLDGKDGVSFHNFAILEDHWTRLLVKNLGRGMPESVVRDEVESLNIRVQGITELRAGRHDTDPAKDRPPTPN